MLYQFETHYEYPPVLPLPVHLPQEQMVTFSQDDEIAEILENVEQRKKSMLDAYFEKNLIDDFAKTLKYIEFPGHYVFDMQERCWQRRQKKSVKCLGRLHYVHPSAGERFYLRILLLNVPGATSFDDLKTVDEELCPTFFDAVKQHGFIQDDQYILETLKEAAAVKLPYALRNLFSALMNHATMANPFKVI